MGAPFGMYLINPASRKKSRSKTGKKRRPFSSQNPMKKSRRKSRRSFARKNPARRKRRRSFARRNPSARRSRLKHVLFLNPRMKKSSRRRRRSFASRNPSRRRGFSRRNPGGPISTIFNNDTLTLGGGVVIGNLGINLILNKILLPNAQGQIPLALPGVNTAVAGYMGTLPVTLYKVLLGGTVGYLLRDRSPRLAQGIIIGTIATAVSDVLRQSNVLSNLPGGSQALTGGVGRYFNGVRGAGAYVPGVPAIFTGPGGAFLHTGAPAARRGTGALVTRKFASMAQTSVPNPFN